MLCIFTDTDKPIFESPINYGRDKPFYHLYDIGEQWLQDKHVENFNNIKKNHLLDDVEKCFSEMFKCWLEIDSEANCSELIEALKQTEQNTLATKSKYVIPSMLNAI